MQARKSAMDFLPFAICHFRRSFHVELHTNEDEKDFLNGFNGIQRIFFR